MLIILCPIIAFYIILYLYNIWFDTWDMIKYDPSYSPEFDQNKSMESIIYWMFILLAFSLEIFLVYCFVKKNKQREAKNK